MTTLGQDLEFLEGDSATCHNFNSQPYKEKENHVRKSNCQWEILVFLLIEMILSSDHIWRYDAEYSACMFNHGEHFVQASSSSRNYYSFWALKPDVPLLLAAQFNLPMSSNSRRKPVSLLHPRRYKVANTYRT